MRQGMQTQIAWPRPGKAVIGLIVSIIGFYVLQLLLLRAGQAWVRDLYLSPAAVIEKLYVWQVVTRLWMHQPDAPFHMIFNLLWLWMFGTQLEKWWGVRRFLIAYVIFGLSGAALILIVGLLSLTAPFRPLLGSFWTTTHLGASSAVIGITVAWGLTYANQEMHFLFLGKMKGKTFVLIVVAIELLMALSFSPVSSAGHFGGIIGAFVLCRGLWKPSKWKQAVKRRRLDKQRKKIESELRVIEGGRRGDDPPTDPSKWN